MSESSTKKARRVMDKASELAAEKLKQQHYEIVKSYIGQFCKMSRRSSRKFARSIRKGINPLEINK